LDARRVGLKNFLRNPFDDLEITRRLGRERGQLFLPPVVFIELPVLFLLAQRVGRLSRDGGLVSERLYRRGPGQHDHG
jgi:hypothetical protein